MSLELTLERIEPMNLAKVKLQSSCRPNILDAESYDPLVTVRRRIDFRNHGTGRMGGAGEDNDDRSALIDAPDTGANSEPPRRR